MANRQKKRVMLQDVAREALVSPATASMALNNRPGIHEETRRQVAEVASRLGYAGLRRAAGKRIAVWMPEADALAQFQAMLLRGITLACAEAGYQTVYVATVAGRYGEPVPSPELLDLDVEGVIMPCGATAAHLARLAAFPGPAVLVDTQRQFPQCPSVDHDDESGARKAVAHLLSLGHRTVAYIGGPGAHGALTWRGYRQAHADVGSAISPRWAVDTGWGVENGYQAMKQMLQDREGRGLDFTALFCGGDELAYGAVRALQEHGLRVPDDVAVVAMDDVEMSAHTNPPLTTVRIPIAQMGATAVRMLVGLINGTWDGPTQVVMPGELIIRNSCGTRA